VTWQRASTALLVLWAAVFWLSEGLLQGVADASLLLALFLVVRRRATLPGGTRTPVLLAVALGGWEALSPLLARSAARTGSPRGVSSFTGSAWPTPPSPRSGLRRPGPCGRGSAAAASSPVCWRWPA
jgi:hypothetical protein